MRIQAWMISSFHLYNFLISSFIRFTSIGLKDATNSMYPAEAFSAKFTYVALWKVFGVASSQSFFLQALGHVWYLQRHGPGPG